VWKIIPPTEKLGKLQEALCLVLRSLSLHRKEFLVRFRANRVWFIILNQIYLFVQKYYLALDNNILFLGGLFSGNFVFFYTFISKVYCLNFRRNSRNFLIRHLWLYVLCWKRIYLYFAISAPFGTAKPATSVTQSATSVTQSAIQSAGLFGQQKSSIFGPLASQTQAAQTNVFGMWDWFFLFKLVICRSE